MYLIIYSKGDLQMMDELHITIGCRIRDLRLLQALSRENLAAKAEPSISSNYLWEIETGRKKLSADMLRRLAIALNVSSDYLLDLPTCPETNEIRVVD